MRYRIILAAFMWGGLLASAASAQFRPLAITDGTILTGDGRMIEEGTIIIKAGKIDEFGRKTKPGMLSRKVSAKDKYVTPGLIDVYSTAGLRYSMSGGQATARAVDAFDVYATDELKRAWAAGVTAAYLPARAGSGIGGLGGVVRMNPGNPEMLILDGEAALSAVIGSSSREGPLARVAVAEGLRKTLQGARDYRESWEDYEDDLEEYEKKLAERAEKKDEDEPKKKGDKDKKKAGPPDKDKKGKGKKANKPDQKKDEKKEELKKPDQPKQDRNADVLLRAIDGELRLRVEAHQPADILNLLDIAEEFNLALILEGASGAHLVAERLVEMKVPVVLWGEPVPVTYQGGLRRYATEESAAILSRAGVEVYFGSGVTPTQAGSAALAMRVARAVGYGYDENKAFETITSKAAKLLGAEKQIGRIRKGMQADLVIWSDHPFAPGAKVERVYVGGEEVYRADAE